MPDTLRARSTAIVGARPETASPSRKPQAASRSQSQRANVACGRDVTVLGRILGQQCQWQPARAQRARQMGGCGDASACPAADEECNGNNRPASVGWGWQRAGREWQRAADAASSARLQCCCVFVGLGCHLHSFLRPRTPQGPPKHARAVSQALTSTRIRSPGGDQRNFCAFAPALLPPLTTTSPYHCLCLRLPRPP
jgi:hypothetical protein